MDPTTLNPELSKPTIRERFLQAYANLPLGSRDEIIIVFEDGPVSWKAAYFEIANDTPRGVKVLDKIEKLNIL
ncbi:MAG: hypothetical protein AAB415_02375 [Patescibacteria group bacterium]